MKKFVAVRTAYYKDQAITKDVKNNHWVNERQADGSVKRIKKITLKKKSYKSAIAELEHVLRTGKTKSDNVFDEYTHKNHTVSLKSCNDLLDAYFKAKDKYKTVTGKKCRSDMNTLFEHVIVMSDEYVTYLENKLGEKNALLELNKCIRDYCNKFSNEFGFTNLGYSLHLDEGHESISDDGVRIFKRNVHCHVMFFNYDFKNKVSNLKRMAKKGKDEKTGKTNSVNDNFSRIQTIASEEFGRLGFERGVSKLITKSKHMKKFQYVQSLIKKKEKKLQYLSERFERHIKNINRHFIDWLTSLLSNDEEMAEQNADNVIDSVLEIDSEEIKLEVLSKLDDIEKKMSKKTHITDNMSIKHKVKSKQRK